MDLRTAVNTIRLLGVMLAASACAGEAFHLRLQQDAGSGGDLGSTGPTSAGGAGGTPFTGGIDFGTGGLAGSSGSQGTGAGGAVVEGGAIDGGAAAEGGGVADAGAAGNRGTCEACDGGACPPGESSCEGACVDLGDDPTNCGRCGHGCGGGKCSKGACEHWVVASEPVIGRIQIASDGAYLAWTDDVFGVSVIPVSGMENGAAPKRLHDRPAGALTIAGKKVVWFTNDVNKKETKLWTADETGGGGGVVSSPPLATGGAAAAMAVEPSFGVAYLADAADDPPGFDVFSCTPVGPDAVCTKIQTVMATKAGVSPSAATAFALTGRDSYLFFGGTAFSRLDLVSGEVTQLVSGLTRNIYQAAAADAEDVFWMEGTINADFSTAFSIQHALHTFVYGYTVADGLVGSSVMGAMTVDNAYVYIATSSSTDVAPPTYIASIAKTNDTVGKPKILYETAATIVAIISVGGAVYWAEQVNGMNAKVTIYGQVFI